MSTKAGSRTKFYDNYTCEMKRSFKVKYVEWPPWAKEIPYENKTVLQGVVKDIYDALSESLNYKFYIESQADHQFGSLQPDKSYSGMLGALYRKEADIGGPFVISDQRAKAVDFTNCLDSRHIGIVTGIVEGDNELFQYINTFSSSVWFSLLASLVIAALTFFEIHQVTNISTENEKLYLLSKCVEIFWSYLTGHAAWLLGPVINILYSLQGSIISLKTIKKPKAIVSDLEELERKPDIIPVTSRSSAVQICFQESEDQRQLWDRMENNTIVFSPKEVEDVLLKVEKGTHILIIDYIYALDIASSWVRRKRRCTLQVEQLPFCQTYISLGLRKELGENIKKEINSRLTYIFQAKLVDRWMNRIINNYTHCTKRLLDDRITLSLKDITGCFVLLGTGLAISFLMLTAEVISFLHKNMK